MLLSDLWRGEGRAERGREGRDGERGESEWRGRGRGRGIGGERRIEGERGERGENREGTERGEWIVPSKFCCSGSRMSSRRSDSSELRHT